MEELKDEIVKLALFYTDIILKLEKSYAVTVDKLKDYPQSEDLIEQIDKTYDSLYDESLEQLRKDAGDIANKYTTDWNMEDDLK